MTAGRDRPGALVRPRCLYMVGTPIGNLEDITYRAIRVLGEVDLIAAEDTRSARVLLGHYGIERQTLSLFKGNEAKRSQMLLEELLRGRSVALISESGMPGLSDPGTRLVQLCVAAGVDVDVIPGPTAAVSALVLSGLPADRFCFFGFLPRQNKERRRVLEQLPFVQATLIFYEAPSRVGETLTELAAVLGERRAALVRELTKLHQEVVRETLPQLNERYREEPPRGEVALVIAGAEEGQALPAETIEAEIRMRVERGESAREIADALAAHGRREVYQRALALQREHDERGAP